MTNCHLMIDIEMTSIKHGQSREIVRYIYTDNTGVEFRETSRI